MMKRLLRVLALALCLMVATPALAVAPGFVVYHGDREVNKIAITVDDCYDSNVLRMMHDLSVEEGIPLTFFVLGSQIRQEDKEIWEGILANGGEVGNHSWKHPNLAGISAHQARNQILMTQEAWDNLLGYHYPLRILRPPFGHFDGEKGNRLALFEEYGVEKTIMWDVSNIDPEQALRETENGSILLFHTNYADLNCLKVLIPMLKDKGYEMVTISELIGLEPLQTSNELYVFPYR